MINVRLAGGLGNQLFQLAAALAVRGDSDVLLDTDGLRNYAVKRSFDLPRILSLPQTIRTNESPSPRVRWKSWLHTARVGRWLPGIAVNDRNFRAKLERDLSGESPRSLWMDGYFQQHWSASAFEKSCAQMTAMMRPDLPHSRVDAGTGVIHIRGGDFLSSELHRVVDADYYVRALMALRTRRPDMRSFCLITDDPGYAQPICDRIQEAHPEVTLAMAPRAHEGDVPNWLQDIVLLRYAPARIIGNSSFAWWAAALDPQRALTLSPDRWTRHATRDLVLSWEITLPV